MTRSLALLTSYLLLASSVAAQPDVIASRFRNLDADKDGKLSADELKGHPLLQNRLKSADANGDGLLTLDEVRALLGQAAPKPKDTPPAKAEPLAEGPKVIAPAAAGVGRMVPDFTFTTLDGRVASLKTCLGKNGLLIAFTNTTCPICKKYGPTLASLESKLSAQGISILFVNPTATEKPTDATAFVSVHKLKGGYVLDGKGLFAATLGATTTAEVFLLDRKRTLVYLGAIDDQYGLGYSLDAAKQNYLLGAADALISGRAIDPAATTAPGCELDRAAAKPSSSAATYHNRISRLVQTHCGECHRAGGVAPFALDTPDQVIAQAGMIRKVVEKGTMPPWFAAPAPEGKPSHWANDRTLPAADKADLLAWLKSDRPLGDPADAPTPRSYADGWLIGKPDAVFEFAKPVAVKATGTMPYQYVVVETELAEDKWVRAVEVRPSARDVVHHVIVSVLPPGKDVGRKLADLVSEERQGFFAIYVPGQSVLSYPDGYAKKLPKGSRLRFQMHYTPNGTATEDRTRVGLVYAETPRFEVKVAGLANPRLRIPPGQAHHPETASVRAPADATLFGFLPHMHLRGEAFRYEVVPAGGKAETVLDVPRYDFNWQLYYRLAEPKPLVKGTTIKATGWFDNSAKNPANPDPAKAVRWGPQTTDEMMLGYVEYVVPVAAGK